MGIDPIERLLRLFYRVFQYMYIPPPKGSRTLPTTSERILFMKTITYDSSSETVAFAAEELNIYLTRMLGNQKIPAIHLSSTEETRTKLDSFSIHITEEGGSITGCNSRSILLGVYDYLHYLGCRFLSPEKESEIIPLIDSSSLPASYKKQASFHHRGVCIEGANSIENILAFIDWLPKVGYNSFFLQFKIPYTFLARWYHHEKNPFLSPEPYTVSDAAKTMKILDKAIKKRDLMLHKVGHGWTGETLGYETIAWQPNGQPLNPEKKHLAAELNGKRELYLGIPADTNLCYHNTDAIDTFASLVTDYAKHHPEVDYLHIWLADEYNNICECESCRQTTLSDQYINLLNEIDQRLTKETLNTRLVFLLYQELLWPPIKERLHNPDRFVLMFAPISRTFESSYELGNIQTEIPPYQRNQVTLPTNLSENLTFLRGWQKLFQGDSFVYDYPLGRAHYGDFGYVHIAKIINSDIKKLHQLKLDGYISCQELRTSLPNSLPNYIMGYTLFDENKSFEELTEEYFTAAYGKDAEEIKEYLSNLSAKSSCDYLNGKGERINPAVVQSMKEIQQYCQKIQPTISKHYDSSFKQWENLFWKRLDYHCQYILYLSQAISNLASGNRTDSYKNWLAMQKFIGQNELEYQPYLDVYRILEVTEKYTGFHQ